MNGNKIVRLGYPSDVVDALSLIYLKNTNENSKIYVLGNVDGGGIFKYNGITIFFEKVRIHTIGILSNSRYSSGKADTLIRKTRVVAIDPFRYFRDNFNHRGRSTMIFISLEENLQIYWKFR